MKRSQETPEAEGQSMALRHWGLKESLIGIVAGGLRFSYSILPSYVDRANSSPMTKALAQGKGTEQPKPIVGGSRPLAP